MAQQYTILFAEDDPDVRASTEEALALKGFRLLVARDGHEAVQLLAQNEVDLLFTDIVMPGLDGIAVAREARRLRPNIKIMFMTGYYSRAGEALPLGTLVFKPLREPQLTQAIRQLLATEC